jgi:hypothetical protein
LADDGSAKPAPQPIVDAAIPSKATMHARFVKTLQLFIPSRNLLPGRSSSKPANTGVAKGHRGKPSLPAACCTAVWTIIVDCAPEPPGVIDAGEKVTVAPGGRPLAVRPTGCVKLPLVEATATV